MLTPAPLRHGRLRADRQNALDIGGTDHVAIHRRLRERMRAVVIGHGAGANITR